VTGGNVSIGIGTASAGLTVVGSDTYGWGKSGDAKRRHNNVIDVANPAYTIGDVWQFAIDLDGGKMWTGKNGTWEGDPVAGTGELFSDTFGDVFPMISEVTAAAFTANFGATAFAYGPPAGFRAGWGPASVTVNEILGNGDLVMSNSWDNVYDQLSIGEIIAEKYPINVISIIQISDNPTIGYIYDTVTESFITLSSSDIASFGFSINDSIGLSDISLEDLGAVIRDALGLTDFTVPVTMVIASDGLFVYDDSVPGWQKVVLEGLDVSDVISKSLGLLVSEWITMKDSYVCSWHGQENLDEPLNLYSLAKDVQLFYKVVDESLVTTDTSLYRLCLTLLGYLGFDDLVSGMKHIAETVPDQMTTTDESSKGFDKSIESALSVVDVDTVITYFISSLSESLTAADTDSLIKRLSVAVTAPLTLTEEVVVHSHLYSIIYEGLSTSVTIEIDDEVWECYVLNTPKFYPSMYSGFDFNSYCVFNNRAFGANDVGIYELTGTTDAGSQIHTGVILKETDFGSERYKRLRKGYIGLDGVNSVLVVESEDGLREKYVIDQHGNATISSELKGKSWKLSVADFSELESIKLIPVILTR
jgi:hypothetical protein